MKSINLKERFYALQKKMIADLEDNFTAVSHPTDKGDLSEGDWCSWLRTYLPKRYQVDRASVVDSNGHISDQIDIVIYDQQYTPFVFNKGRVMYIPAEGVYAVFEVKPNLDKENIEYAGKKAESVRSLHRTSADIYTNRGKDNPQKPKPILAGILTLTSRWNPPLGESFEDCIRSLPPKQTLDLGCALQSGAFQVDYDENREVKEICTSTQEEALIFFFLKLLMELQKLGTVTAIDIAEYAKALDSI